MAVYVYTTLSDPLLAEGTVAYDINDVDQIVGLSGLPIQGFLYSGGTATILSDPFATITAALGINDVGQIVGFYADSSNHQHGFLLSGGAYTTIDDSLSTVAGTVQPASTTQARSLGVTSTTSAAASTASY